MDWKQLLARLAAGGLTQVVIAERCGVAQSTISALSRGETKAPGYELGKALEAMAASLPPPESDQAPGECAESGARVQAASPSPAVAAGQGA